jgi:phosphoadenosine phosphosulfate reductase
MALWKNGRFVEDGFVRLADDAAIPEGAAVLVSLARYRAERAALLALGTPVGIVIEPGADWSDIVADLPRLAVVAADLPKFADGRAFSVGRLLRERDGFAGELRAIGDFFLDQIPLLKRVGFDAFETENPLVVKGLAEGRWPEVAEYLQPAFEPNEVPAGTRPWARRPAARAAE